MTAAPAQQSTNVADFLRLIHPPGTVFEIRAPQTSAREDGQYATVYSGYFTDPEVAASAIKNEIPDLAPAVFCTTNPVRPDLLARADNCIKSKAKATTQDGDILRRRWLFLDIDPKRPAGISATDAESNEAMKLAKALREHLAGQGWPEPLRGMSGNGVYLLYGIDLPVDDNGLVRSVLKSLAVRFNSDTAEIDATVHNASRIIKVLGTVARKGSDFQGNGEAEARPHRRSWFVPTDQIFTSVSARQLRDVALAETPAKDSEKTPQTPPKTSGFDRFEHTPDGVEGYLVKHGVEVRYRNRKPVANGTMLILGRCPVDPTIEDHDGSSIGVLVDDGGKISYGNWHKRSGGLGATQWVDVREALEPGYRAYRERQRAEQSTKPESPTTSAAKPSKADSKAANPGKSASKSKKPSKDDQNTKGGQAIAKHLLRLAESIERFHDDSNNAYVSVPVGDHTETYRVDSKAFKEWWAGLYYRTTQQVPLAAALGDAINALEGLAKFDGPQIETSLRVAEHDGKIYIDLANDDWQVVEVSSECWKVIDKAPVRFLRPNAMQQLPTPVRGGHIDDLRRFVNIGSDSDFQLLVGFMTCALRPSGPFFILNLKGETGTAKSCAIEFVRMLIDPNRALIRSAPRSEDCLMVAAEHSWVMTADNLSEIWPWLSNCLCRLSNGGGISKREHYANREEVILVAERPIILGGITEIVTMSDLVDRTIGIELPVIPKHEKKSERKLYADFQAARPRLLGSLLDGIVFALRNIETVEIPEGGRMFDAAEWCYSAWPGYGWNPDDFIIALEENRTSGRHASIEAEPIGAVLVKMIERLGGTWSGTATNLWDDLNKEWDGDQPGKRPPKGWPGAPNILTNKLRVLVPDLRETGINVELGDRKDKTRVKIISITTIETRPESKQSQDAKPSPKSQPSPKAQPSPGANSPDDAPERLPDACVASAQHVADSEPVVESFRAELTTYFADDPELPKWLDLYDQWVGMYHEVDEHPWELAARMAFEKVLADQAKEEA